MGTPKQFSRHDHSGQLLPHHHTTYLGLGLLLSLVGVILFAVTGIYRAQALTLTQNGNIAISGTVFGTPPTEPATILNPSSGDTVLSSPIIVSGSCGAGLLVKIFRNDLLAGSSICSGAGTYNVQISLVIGKNTLRARNYDLQNQAGPDSSDVVVFYTPPTQQIDKVGTSNIEQTQSTQNLLISSPDAYKSAAVNDIIEWPFDTIGGQSPYAVYIDWGDGETTLLSIKQAGHFIAKHLYKKAGTYKITLKLTDALGNKAVLEVVAQVNGAGAMPQITQKPQFYDRVWPLFLAWPIYVFLMMLVGSFWLGEKYYQHVLFKSLSTRKTNLTTTRPGS